ncbi:MAG: hypothetical protein NC122_09195 [Faecalibacterium sp.]|nr:hypothetical protein [Ruminococcus sp.]MCM1392293.1 hypothetical protein [Ruminococcus sp.]MCM1486367.1 hypothetical protein [Faecalibacterium sp.]
MKKMTRIASLVLCVIMMFSFVACRNQTEAETDEGVSTVTEKVTEKEKVKKNRTVSIELPLSVIDEKYQNDLDAYCEDNGFISAKLNKRTQTVSIKMKSFSHELLLSNVGMKVLKSINEVASSKEYKCVKEIKSVNTDDFSEVTILVDKKKYEKNGISAAFVIGQSCLLYQLYTEEPSYNCTVNVIDKKTNQLIDKRIYTDKDI